MLSQNTGLSSLPALFFGGYVEFFYPMCSVSALVLLFMVAYAAASIADELEKNNKLNKKIKK